MLCMLRHTKKNFDDYTEEQLTEVESGFEQCGASGTNLTAARRAGNKLCHRLLYMLLRPFDAGMSVVAGIQWRSGELV